MRKIGSIYISGRSADLLKVKVCLLPFYFVLLKLILQARQDDTEALVVDTGNMISLQLYV